MKPNIVTATTSLSSSLTALPTTKIVRHPRAKKQMNHVPQLPPPDDETLTRLNDLASQFPFCIRHRGSNSPLL
ncbi:MAG TPA: hypothetical protein VG605_11660 [Puia sp.]|jgi:hypothetical protein|nr:hypothetical protein [Puia sp.]